MNIPQKIYEVFYKALAKCFRTREFKDVENELKIKLGRGLWTDLIKSETKLRALRIAGEASADAEIFYRWRGLARSNGYVDAKDEVLILAFIYMGISIPTSILNTELDDEIKAKILLQVFMELNAKHLIENEYSDYIVYNYKTKILKGSSNDPDIIAKKSAQYNIERVSDNSLKSDYVIHTIMSFLEHLRQKQYRDAFDMIYVENYKRAINYEQFRSWFMWSSWFGDEHVWKVKSLDTAYPKCYVSFIEVINTEDAFQEIGLSHGKIFESLDILGRLTEQLQTSAISASHWEGLPQDLQPNCNLIEEYEERLISSLSLVLEKDENLETLTNLPKYSELEMHGIGNYLGYDYTYNGKKKHHCYLRTYIFETVNRNNKWMIYSIKGININS